MVSVVIVVILGSGVGVVTKPYQGPPNDRTPPGHAPLRPTAYATHAPAAFLHHSVGHDPRRRAEQFRSTFIGYLDPVSLVPHSKLTLNRNNDGFYQDHIVPLQRLSDRGLTASQRALKRAYEWFRAKVRETLEKPGDGRTLAAFLDTLADRLFFTVTDELNAFKVFETLNARGVRKRPVSPTLRCEHQCCRIR